MLKTIEIEMHSVCEIHPDINPELMPRAPVLTASLVLPENVPTLEVKIEEFQKREEKTVAQKGIECWCKNTKEKTTICANCIMENDKRRRSGKKGLYFSGVLYGADPEEETKQNKIK